MNHIKTLTGFKLEWILEIRGRAAKMVHISKLEGLKREAQKEGWADFIQTPVDEKALLAGFTFSWERFNHFRYFVDRRIKLSKNVDHPGTKMELLPWHEILTGSLFGWIGEDGLRRFNRGYIEIPKKNSKTTLFGAIGLYMLDTVDGDGEEKPEVYTCANSKEQAGILWSIAADMVEEDSVLRNRFNVIRSTRRIYPDARSWFAAWSSDHSAKDGPDAHCVLVDELHEWKGAPARDFWGKIRYAGIARKQPLCPLAITTSGDDMNSLCYQQRTVAKRIIEGTSEDLRMYAKIYGANEEKIKADPNYWKTREARLEANPSLDLILKDEEFQAAIVAVENDPTEKARFFRYRLGVWTESGTPWLKAGTWEKNIGPGFTEDQLRGHLCYTGLDLSSVHDFTAISHVLPYIRMGTITREDGSQYEGPIKKFKWIARVFCPADTFAERVLKDSTGSFRVWHEQGFIKLTPGDAIHHETIYSQIEKDSQFFGMKQIAYDRNSAAWVIQEIQKKLPDIELFPFNQSMAGMSTPTKSFTACMLKGLIEHNDNPVLKYCASKAVVESHDAQNNMMLHKAKSTDKIDPVVAGVMAYNQAELGTMGLEKKFSPYSNEGFKAINEFEGRKI